jgi:hypothetical protein
MRNPRNDSIRIVDRGKINTGSLMKRPAIITTPIPTPEEVAKLLGISKKDQAFVKALVHKWAWSPETIREFGEPTGSPNPNKKPKKPAAKRGSRENGRS